MQSVNISSLIEAMSIQVGCTFRTGASAMGCQLTVCRRGDKDVCLVFRLSPASPTSVLHNLLPGTYMITHVVEIEEDLSEVNVRGITMLGNLETTLSLPTTSKLMVNSNA